MLVGHKVEGKSGGAIAVVLRGSLSEPLHAKPLRATKHGNKPYCPVPGLGGIGEAEDLRAPPRTLGRSATQHDAQDPPRGRLRGLEPGGVHVDSRGRLRAHESENINLAMRLLHRRIPEVYHKRGDLAQAYLGHIEDALSQTRGAGQWAAGGDVRRGDRRPSQRKERDCAASIHERAKEAWQLLFEALGKLPTDLTTLRGMGKPTPMLEANPYRRAPSTALMQLLSNAERTGLGRPLARQEGAASDAMLFWDMREFRFPIQRDDRVDVSRAANYLRFGSLLPVERTAPPQGRQAPTSTAALVEKLVANQESLSKVVVNLYQDSLKRAEDSGYSRAHLEGLERRIGAQGRDIRHLQQQAPFSPNCTTCRTDPSRFNPYRLQRWLENQAKVSPLQHLRAAAREKSMNSVLLVCRAVLSALANLLLYIGMVASFMQIQALFSLVGLLFAGYTLVLRRR